MRSNALWLTDRGTSTCASRKPTFPFNTLAWLGNLVILHLPAYEDETVCSETSAYEIQTSGNYPEESIKHSEHVESLKSKIKICFSHILNVLYYPPPPPCLPKNGFDK
jgi:hypothetical protein